MMPKYMHRTAIPPLSARKRSMWRRSLNGRYSGRSCFALHVVCGDCGAFYGSEA